MKTFRFAASVLEPSALTPDVRASFESAVRARGGSDLRVHADNEDHATVSFLLDAATERDALLTGSEMTLSALENFQHIRWTSMGITYWQEG